MRYLIHCTYYILTPVEAVFFAEQTWRPHPVVLTSLETLYLQPGSWKAPQPDIQTSCGRSPRNNATEKAFGGAHIEDKTKKQPGFFCSASGVNTKKDARSYL